MKIEYDANERCLSVVELFLLAISRTVKERIENYDRSIILNMLKRRFSPESKLIRFILRGIDRNKSQSKTLEQIRVNYLKPNRSEKLKKNPHVTEGRMELKRKRTNLMSILTPSIKSLFKKKKVGEMDIIKSRANHIAISFIDTVKNH